MRLALIQIRLAQEGGVARGANASDDGQLAAPQHLAVVTPALRIRRHRRTRPGRLADNRWCARRCGPPGPGARRTAGRAGGPPRSRGWNALRYVAPSEAAEPRAAG